MKVLNFREQPQGSKVQALFDLEFEIKIPELDVCCFLICRNWKVLKTIDGRFFPVSPAFSEEVAPGQKKWIGYNELDPRFSKGILGQIMKLLEPYLQIKKPADTILENELPF